MRAHVAGLLAFLALSLPPLAQADVLPPPPAGLKSSPGPQPRFFLLVGLAASSAVALSGIAVARSRRPALLVFSLLTASLILAGAGILAVRASREWDEQIALKAE